MLNDLDVQVLHIKHALPRTIYDPTHGLVWCSVVGWNNDGMTWDEMVQWDVIYDMGCNLSIPTYLLYVPCGQVCVGTGVQLWSVCFLLLFFSMVRLVSPLKRGDMLTVFILIYVLTGGIAGYNAAKIHRRFRGTDWLKVRDGDVDRDRNRDRYETFHALPMTQYNTHLLQSRPFRLRLRRNLTHFLPVHGIIGKTLTGTPSILTNQGMTTFTNAQFSRT